MSLLGYSDDFDLDDDGVLRDTGSSSGLFLDDHGIIHDDSDFYTQVTQWTDSGLGGDKRSSTSTLKQFEFPASFEEDPNVLDERSLNISELEASRDFTFDASYASADDPEFYARNSVNLSQSLNFQDTTNLEITGSEVDLFNEEYYQQLKELGVLVDGAELSVPRQSLQEFESIEAELVEGNKLSDEDALDNYLKRSDPKNISYQTVDNSFQLNSEHFPSQDDQRHSYFHENEGKAFETLDISRPDSRARSDRTDRTVSSRSFPEVSPEEALDLYNASQKGYRLSPGNQDSDVPLVDNDAESIEFDESEKDRDEAQDGTLVRPSTPSRIPRRVNNRAENSPVAFNNWTSDPDSEGLSRSATPVNKKREKKKSGNQRESPKRTAAPESPKSRSRPGSDSRAQRHHRRSDSGGSQLSTTSEIVPQVQPSPRAQRRPNSQKALGKAKSEESFFDISLSEKNEKIPKRILPQPNMTADKNFKVKCKSTTNISSKPGPVKPTHMSLSEITSLTIDDSEDVHSESHSVTSDRSRGELKAKLSHESTQRKQATELVHQLQKDYDNLLSKYALAELTIDQLRLGAKITLHTDSPTPSQAYSGTLVASQQPQVTSLMGASRGLITSSPAPGKSGRFSPVPSPENEDFPEGKSYGDGVVQTGNFEQILLDEDTEDESPGLKLGDGDPTLLASLGVDTVKITLEQKTRGLDEKTESFKKLLEDDGLSVDQQEKVLDKLRIDHDKLRRDYLQAKQDCDVLRRTSGTDATFDEDKELEGELFRLGMKFDDIHETVDSNVKLRSSQRLPFQGGRSRAGTPDNLDKAVDQVKPKLNDPNAGYNLVKPKPSRVFDDKLQRLHEDYSKLMQLYHKFKQRARSPRNEQEIDNLVQKLWNICQEAPDVFRLPQEIQERLEEMNRFSSDQSSPLISPSPDTRGQSDSSESTDQYSRDRDSPAALRLSQLETPSKKDPAITNADRRKLEDLRVGRFSPLASDRGRNSPSGRPRSAQGGRGSPLNPRQGPTSGRNGRSSPFNRNSPGLKKSSQTSSVSSLPDSGISEHSHTKGPMSLTKRSSPQLTREFDTDSGFIGSVSNFGSGRHPNLHLRHNGSVDGDRLQNVEEGAIGGRESPAIGRLSENARSQQQKKFNTKDQSQMYGDQTDSDSVDLNLQRRRVPMVESATSSMEEESEDPTRNLRRKGSFDSSSKPNQSEQRSKVSNTPSKTSQQKPKPKVYYSEDSLSEDEDDGLSLVSFDQGHDMSRSSQASMSRSYQQTELESRSVSSQKTPLTSAQSSSDRFDKQSAFGKTKTFVSESETDNSASISQVRKSSRKIDQKASSSRRGSKDSVRKSDITSAQSKSANKNKESERPPGRRYSKDKRVRKESTDTEPNHDSTFTVDDSENSVLQSGRSRSDKEGQIKKTSANKAEKELESDGSQKAHSNSSRLKALQLEIQRLKDDVKKVNDGDRADTTTPQHPRLRYDPENPFSFMEGEGAPVMYPRRRANSFSGSPARQYDDWINFQPALPRQPVSALPRKQDRGRDEFDSSERRNRESSRKSKKLQRPFSASVAEKYDQMGYREYEEFTDDDDAIHNQHYDHDTYRPSRHHLPGMEYDRPSRRPYRLTANGGRAYSSRTSSSEDYDDVFSDDVARGNYAQPQYFIPSGYIYYPNGTDNNYVAQPMRSSSPIAHPSRLSTTMPAESVPQANGQVPMYGLQPAMCPHCGRTSYHTHGAYVFPATTPMDGNVETSPEFLQLGQRRSRSKGHRRSRSLSRQRYYSPDRNPETRRYFVREFAVDQSDSDLDFRSRPRHRQRSQSLSRSHSHSRSRSRPRKGHSYRTRRSNSMIHLSSSDSDSTISAGSGPSLDESLHVASRTARDIDFLTHKMMTTVKGEITRHSRSRERKRRK